MELPSEIRVGENTYVLKQESNSNYVIVRTYSAGVFAGYLEKQIGKEVTLSNARRIWYWEGAASLSQLAVEGTTKPEKCKIAMPVNVILTEAIEILSVTEKAKNIIEGAAVWKV